MKQKFQNGVRKVGDAAKARPQETRWSIIGVIAGAFIGLMIGGVGIAAMDGARGVPLSCSDFSETATASAGTDHSRDV